MTAMQQLTTMLRRQQKRKIVAVSVPGDGSDAALATWQSRSTMVRATARSPRAKRRSIPPRDTRQPPSATAPLTTTTTRATILRRPMLMLEMTTTTKPTFIE